MLYPVELRGLNSILANLLAATRKFEDRASLSFNNQRRWPRECLHTGNGCDLGGKIVSRDFCFWIIFILLETGD
jgi:hypothetical protein